MWHVNSPPADWAPYTHRATGFQIRSMAGPGLTSSRGASRRTTTAAGRSETIAGSGFRPIASSPPFTPRRSSPFMGGLELGNLLGGQSRAASRLVPAGTARGLCAALLDEPRLLSPHQFLGPCAAEHPRRSLAALRASGGAARGRPAADVDEPPLCPRCSGRGFCPVATRPAVAPPGSGGQARGGTCRGNRRSAPPERIDPGADGAPGGSA